MNEQKKQEFMKRIDADEFVKNEEKFGAVIRAYRSAKDKFLNTQKNIKKLSEHLKNEQTSMIGYAAQADAMLELIIEIEEGNKNATSTNNSSSSIDSST